MSPATAPTHSDNYESSSELTVVDTLPQVQSIDLIQKCYFSPRSDAALTKTDPKLQRFAKYLQHGVLPKLQKQATPGISLL